MKNFLLYIILLAISIVFAFIFCEVILRVKHSLVPNYDIEMWKYAKELKKQVEDKNIGHVHRENKSGIFQGVNIKINNFGQRDVDYNNDYLNKFEKKFLIIGSSITLGWGVDKEKTFSHMLNIYAINEKKNWLFINGGIGNYNSQRYVNNYLKNWSNLSFNHIIINYFVNDAEIKENKKTNLFIKYTHTGVVLWKLFKSFDPSLKKENISSYYEKIYADNYKGFVIARSEIAKLNEYCKANKIKCILVNIPDIHQLNPYKLNFINKKIENFAKDIDIQYIDLLPVLKDLDEKKLRNNFQDSHPNALAHELIAKEIFRKIK